MVRRTAISIVVLTVVLSTGLLLAQLPQDAAAKRQQVNADLNKLAKEMAKSLGHPGFRGLLHAEIAQSKNREQILELEQFLGRSVGRPEAPPGLMQLQETARQTRARIKASGVWQREGLALSFPVKEHRANWRGGPDFLVSFAPADDEKAVTALVAYSVQTGQPVPLDPKMPPQIPVLVVAPEEHESHTDQVPQPAPPDAPPPRVLKSPPGQLYDNEKVLPSTQRHQGNSILYGYYTGTKDDKEPWYRGSAEIYVIFVDSCRWARFNVYYVNDENRSYYTKPDIPFSYTGGCSDNTYVAVWESDGGSSVSHTVQLSTGMGNITKRYTVADGDDFIEQAWFNKSQFPYNTLYSGYMGYYAWVNLYKVP